MRRPLLFSYWDLGHNMNCLIRSLRPSQRPGSSQTAQNHLTKPREPLLLSPLDDEPVIENLPEPIPLTPEQMRAQAEADERDRQRQLEWAMVVQALNDNSLAVVRAMRRFRNEAEQAQVERVLTSYEDGSFLIDRLGAGLVVDQDLAVVLLNLRRRLIDEYGTGPAAMMLIDRAVVAYQDFIRISGWTGNTALMVEAEFFGRKKPSAGLRDRHGEIRGLTVEEYINRLGQDLIPLAERCARVMREALSALEATRGAPSQAVERSRPARISVVPAASTEQSTRADATSLTRVLASSPQRRLPGSTVEPEAFDHQAIRHPPFPSCSTALRASNCPSAWRIDVKANDTPLSRCRAARISAGRTACGARARSASSTNLAFDPRSKRFAVGLLSARARRACASRGAGCGWRGGRLRRVGAVGVGRFSAGAGRDAISWTARMAAAYPAANASRRMSST